MIGKTYNNTKIKWEAGNKFQEGMGNSRNVDWIGGRTYMGRTTSNVVEVPCNMEALIWKLYKAESQKNPLWLFAVSLFNMVTAAVLSQYTKTILMHQVWYQ